MKQYLNVRCSSESVPNLEVNVDTVYVRTNIQRVEEELFSGWQYDEIQYDIREYQGFIGSDINAIAEVVSTTLEDTTNVGEALATALVEIEMLKAEIQTLKGGA